MKLGPRGSLVVVVALAAAGSMAFDWVTNVDLTKRNFNVFPEMAYSVAAESQATSRVTKDRKTLQAPPRGTIPRGFMPLHYQATAADAERAGRELHNPISARDAQALARGREVFRNYCQVCHGPTAQGDGPMTRKGVPSFNLHGRAKALPDGHLFHILTFGQNNMSSYAAQLTREDRWKVILYLRSLQGRAP